MSRKSLVGSLLLAGAALALPLEFVAGEGCEMQIPASWQGSCPSEECPPFKPCQPRLAQHPVSGVLVVVCTCGSSGQLPYCCVVAQERATGIPTGFGYCNAFCQTSGDCQAVFNPTSGLYEAICD